MNKQDKIKLIKTEYIKDKYGVNRKVETVTEVFAEIQSVSAKEFYNASVSDIKAQYRADIYIAEYDDQEVVEYNGKRFAVYRTYQSRLDKIELYLQKELGK